MHNADISKDWPRIHFMKYLKNRSKINSLKYLKTNSWPIFTYNMMEITMSMRSLTTVLFLLIILSVWCCTVTVAGESMKTDIVLEILASDEMSGITKAPPMEGFVAQGETKYYTYTPTSGNKLEISLRWTKSSGNDLDLYLHPPNTDAILIHDEIDGISDGKISLRTSLSSGDLNQMWQFDVIGANVSGTQSYTLILHSFYL